MKEGVKEERCGETGTSQLHRLLDPRYTRQKALVHISYAIYSAEMYSEEACT